MDSRKHDILEWYHNPLRALSLFFFPESFRALCLREKSTMLVYFRNCTIQESGAKAHIIELQKINEFPKKKTVLNTDAQVNVNTKMMKAAVTI